MKLSVVIRVFNEEKHIARLLYGISQQTYQNPEVILVDSGSTDDTLDIAAQFPVKIVHIDPHLFTFGRSLNVGIAAASGDLVVITSAHCYPVYPDWLEQLTKPFDGFSVGLCYGKQRGGETNHYSEHQFFHKYFPDTSIMQQAHPYSHNANAAIRRELWQIHPYEENLTGLEDLAWSSWLMDSGYEIAYVAEAEVIHLHNETFKQVYNRYKREAIALKQILPNSRFTFIHFAKSYTKSLILDLTQARRDKALSEYLLGIIKFRFVQYLATFMGYRFKGEITAQTHQGFYYPPHLLDHKTPKKRSLKPIQYNDNH